MYKLREGAWQPEVRDFYQRSRRTKRNVTRHRLSSKEHWLSRRQRGEAMKSAESPAYRRDGFVGVGGLPAQIIPMSGEVSRGVEFVAVPTRRRYHLLTRIKVRIGTDPQGAGAAPNPRLAGSLRNEDGAGSDMVFITAGEGGRASAAPIVPTSPAHTGVMAKRYGTRAIAATTRPPRSIKNLSENVDTVVTVLSFLSGKKTACFRRLLRHANAGTPIAAVLASAARHFCLHQRDEHWRFCDSRATDAAAGLISTMLERSPLLSVPAGVVTSRSTPPTSLQMSTEQHHLWLPSST